MTILDLVGRDITLRKVASTRGGEYTGPCPWCGGRDRFRVWPFADKPGYWCRQCGRKGDAIQYLRDHDGLSYCEASTRLGQPLAERSLATSPRITPKAPPLAQPPSDAWQAQAGVFVEQCERALWSPAGGEALAYLHWRGLADDTLQAVHVGYHANARYEPLGAWGLESQPTHKAVSRRPGDARDNDGYDMLGLPSVPEPHTVWLPRGIVFPWWSGGTLWRVTFRRLARLGSDIQAFGQQGGSNHFMVKGSANLLYNIDTVHANRPAMLVEAPLDALSISQEAGDLVAAVAASTGWGRLERWIGRLSLASIVLLGFDADDAGETAAAWWRETLGRRAKRWRPYWDDSNAMLQGGVDLRTWIREGLGQELYWWRDMAAWSDQRRDAWAERAAILEVDAGFVRHEAERTAYLIASSAAMNT